jgi:hypothetical protein
MQLFEIPYFKALRLNLSLQLPVYPERATTGASTSIKTPTFSLSVGNLRHGPAVSRHVCSFDVFLQLT